MAYSPALIANYFITKAQELNQELTPMKLIKLVYYAHGWSLALRKEPLINESISAWRYGPVIESLYQVFKKFGNEKITECAPVSINENMIFNEDFMTKAVLNKVWDVYGKYTAIQLSNLTHEKDSPWYEVWHEQDGKKYNGYPINNQLIQSYFEKEAQSN